MKFLRSLNEKVMGFIKNSPVKRAFDKLFRTPNIGSALLRDYPRKVKDFLDQHGSTVIRSIKVFRHPIPSMINKALDFITRGQWSTLKQKYGYDQLFHLGIIVNDNIILERNQTMNIGSYKHNPKDEFFQIPYTGGLTISNFIDNAVKAEGPSIFRYGAFDNNCQSFALQLLRHSNLLTSQARQFIEQPVDKLIKELPSYVKPVANALTDVGGAIDAATQEYL